MKTRVLRHALIPVLIFLMAAPAGVLGQATDGSAVLGRDELTQLVAPIALYPDSLLANILVAATFPLEVVEADRWLKQNSSLQGGELNAAVDKMSWDLSVKALVPFPEVLSMMSDKIDWTQKLGDAFLAQQSDVMDAVQTLRSKAQNEGYLKSSSEQTVENQGQSIEIEPVDPTIVYVPSYDPTVVYGVWPYPAYPPIAYCPYAPVVAAGVFGFAAGVAVGAAWNGGWGHWNWNGGTMNVNVNRNVNINHNHINNYQSGNWNQAARNGGVGPHPSSGGWGNGAAARDDFRGRTGGGQSGGFGGMDGSRGAYGTEGGFGRPNAASVQDGLRQREGGGSMFHNSWGGGEDRMNSDRGFESRHGSGYGSHSGGFGDGGWHGGGGGWHGGGGGGGRRR